MERDRNQLFAMKALQLEYIDFEQYTVACADPDNDAPISERLLQRNWLTPEQRDDVNRLVEQEISEQGRPAPGAGAGDGRHLAGPLSTEDTLLADDDEGTLDGSEDLGPLPASHFEQTLDSTDESGGPVLPASHYEQTLDPSEQSASLEATQDMDAPGDGGTGAASEHTQDYGPEGAGYVQMGTVDSANPSASTRSRYTFTKMHGEGGIGRVWLAHDQHLNREIALKEIRPDKEQSKSAWKRFVREAQITSQLEHPNIIPVYELSSRSSEQGWFYTMRFVRGDTFRHAIDEYHRHRRDGKATELELRSLLTSFIAICHALGYAHSRGVLHRDLKPSNIMLGAFGEVVVLDWGLAKMVDNQDDADEDLDLMAAGPVSVTAEADIAATQQGAVLGTLPYMAPEQAAGRLDIVDPRTDIYGLGAILYAVLTGNHPHKGTTTREVRSRILKEPTPRVRHEDKSAHPVLDSICAKAMAKEQADRYAKASLLGDDIERWMADEPVSCHPESRVAQVFRWLRRHKTWAKSIATALLVVTTVSLVAVILINAARQRTARALEAEKVALVGEREAKELATERFQESRETVDKMMTGVSDALSDFPGMRPLRQRFLGEAARKYEEYAGEEVAGVAMRLEAARSLLRLGDVQLELDAADDAQKSYDKAVTRLQTILDGGITSTDVRLALVNARTKQGSLLSRLGDQEEALGFYGQAAEELDDLIADDDPDGTFRFTRAGLLVNQASVVGRSGDSEQAIRLLGEAITVFESLAEAYSDTRYVDGLAMARTNLGGALRKQGRNSEAIVPLQAAVEAYRQLSQVNRDDPRYLERSAATQLNLAAAFRTLGRDREEHQAYRSALADYELLVADRPDVPLYQERRALTKIDLAMVLHIVGNNREASELLVAAIQETQHLLDTRLGLPTYYEQLSLGQATLGRVLADLGDPEASLYFEAAIDGYAFLIEGDPSFAVSYRLQRADVRSSLGKLYGSDKKVDAARTTLRSAAEEFDGLLKDDPNNDALKNALARSYTRLGDLEWDAQQQAAASEYYQQAITLRETLDREPEHRYAFARLLIECRDPKLVNAERASQLARVLVTEAAENPRYASILGAAYFRAGQVDEAIEQLSTVDGLSPHGGTAHEFWLVVALVNKGGEQNQNSAKNRMQSARNRMDLDVPARPRLVRLRAEAEAALAPPAADDAEQDGDR